MKLKTIATLVIALGVAISMSAVAQTNVPQKITYEGVLEQDGQPVNATLDMTFRLYKQSGAYCNKQWVFTGASSVTVAQGRFSVVLDVVEHQLNDGCSWIGVSIDGAAELQPRKQLLSAPYSIRSRETDALPPGMIMPFYGRINASIPVPEGWLIADGSIIDKSANPEYAALVDHLRLSNLYTKNPNGVNNGLQPASSNQARLPDLDNVFLRGQGGGTLGYYQANQNKSHGHTLDIDYRSQSHTHTGTTNNGGSHSHTTTFREDKVDGGAKGVVDWTKPSGSDPTRSWTSSTHSGHSHGFTTNGASTTHDHTGSAEANGGSEARPNAVVVYWLIKY